jgi:hypothetical protein
MKSIEMMNNAIPSSIKVKLLAFMLMLTTAAMPVGAASLGPVSEGTPPAACDPGHFVEEVRCSGRYCDNIRITCRRLPNAVLGEAHWKRWVSEEHGGRDCGRNSFIAGLACQGAYCDEISLYCVEITNLTRLPSCEEVGPVSEERGGRLNFFGAMRGDKAGQKFLARSMRCAGRYCDNKYFTVCEL